MHLPTTALPGAQTLLLDPAGQSIAAQAFGRRSTSGRQAVTTGGMGTVTLVGGTATVSTPAIQAGSLVFLAGQNSSGTAGALTVSARTPGFDFTITSTSATDTRLVAWLILDTTA